MTPQQLRQSTRRGGEQRFQPVVIFDGHFVRLPYLFADCGDATDAARQAAADYQAMSLARELKAQGEPVAQTGWYDDAPCPPCQVSQQA